MDESSLSSLVASHHQEQLIQFYSTLDSEKKEKLYNDCFNVDYETISNFAEIQSKCNILNDVKPLPEELCGDVDDDNSPKWRSAGLSAIAENSVALILLAGGQGTRLGTLKPKGMYSIGLQSRKTLYQWQAEKITCLEKLAAVHGGKSNCTLPWYIMTSEHTRTATEDFFKSHNYFGRDANDVIIFEQNMIPVIDTNGKILLEKPYKISRSPGGNGSVFEALKANGIFEDMCKRNIKHTFVYAVDNILVKIADPTFLGFCINLDAESGAKVVDKIHPNEALGVFGIVNGKYKVIEYSEVSPEDAARVDSNGKLVYNACNICIHYFRFDFLQKMANTYESQMQFHIAKKKVPYVAENGDQVMPQVPNAIKLEKFIFDAYQFAKSIAIFRVHRNFEFSPLKNALPSKSDNELTSRNSLHQLHHHFITAAGGVVNKSQSAEITNGVHSSELKEYPIVCEISPLLTYEGENLEELCKGKVFESPVLLE